jgi:hypothetical protein
MKHHIIVAIITLTTLASLPAADKDSEAIFLEKVQSALDAKDGSALLGLVFFDGVEPQVKEMITKQITDVAEKSVTSAALVETEPSQLFEYTIQGQVYRTNLKPLKMLRLEYDETIPLSSGTLSKPSISLPVGEKDGVLMITTAAPVKNE